MKNNKSSFYIGDGINGNSQQVYWIADEFTPFPISQENVRLAPNFNKHLIKIIYSTPGVNDINNINPTMSKMVSIFTSVNQVTFSDTSENEADQTSSLGFQLARSNPKNGSTLKTNSKKKSGNKKNQSEKTGWVPDGHGCWSYYRDNEKVCSEWIYDNGKDYYMDSAGYMMTGLQTIGDNKYFFKPSGEMVRGWRKLYNNKWYYFNSLGEMIIGWYKIDDKWYYFDDKGKMVTGSMEIMGAVYNFDSNGVNSDGATPMFNIDDFRFPKPDDYTDYLTCEQYAAKLMELHQKYHGFFNEKQSEYVTQGAILACTKGTAMTKLDTTRTAHVAYVGNGRPVLGCDACENYKNIHSFFTCKATEADCFGLPKRDKINGLYKCIPLVANTWHQDNSNTPLIWNSSNGTVTHALKSDAVLTCSYKGVIGIIEAAPEEETVKVAIAVAGEDKASQHNTFKVNIATFKKDNPSMDVRVVEADKFNSSKKVLEEVISISKSIDGGIDHLRIEAHSDPKGIILKYEDKLVPESDWDEIVFKPNAYIRFTGCNTGGEDGIKSENSIAQKVANKTGKKVYGFVNNTSQTVDENGRYFQVPVRKKYGQKVVDDYTEFLPQS